MRPTKDGSGAYTTHRYRDLFAERGHSRQESRAKLDGAFQQLFHGDRETQAVYYEGGSNGNGPLAYVTDVANHDARTEGMSYGMMIAVQMNKKREFDAIWNWANTYMLITDPANPSHGYFAWSMNVDGTPRSDTPAPDGEEYFVMSLYFAANRWGNGTGIYNYKAQADRILSLMRHHPVESGRRPFRIHPGDAPYVPSLENGRPTAPGERSTAPLITVGPMVEEAHSMIRFVPDSVEGGADDVTDPSYHLPGFYELWARWGPAEDRAFWATAAEKSREFFAKVDGPGTGLTPERANFDGSTARGRDGSPSPFAYDAWRSISNWSVDYSWWQKDPEEAELSRRMQTFLYGQGIETFDSRYTLDGKPLLPHRSTGILATTAVGSLAREKNAISDAFIDELWSAPVPSGPKRYYDGTLYLMSLLHCSGNFRIYFPVGNGR